MLLTAPATAPADPPACADAPDRLRALCVSYCEDLDCTAEAPADLATCDRLFTSYQRRSDGEAPPCEVAP
ncbi:MAG: hypothetical protein ACI8PZ_006357 [Myxococcota bacterium]|jgi:hypothetical protein